LTNQRAAYIFYLASENAELWPFYLMPITANKLPTRNY